MSDTVADLARKVKALEDHPVIDPSFGARLTALEAASKVHHATYTFLYDHTLNGGDNFWELPEGSISESWACFIVDLHFPIPPGIHQTTAGTDIAGADCWITNYSEFKARTRSFITRNQRVTMDNSYT